MMIALYASIWLALVALTMGELGRRVAWGVRSTPVWAIPASVIGVCLAALHSMLAIGVVYDWNHARAVAVTAERSAEVYGVAWAGSLYVNYVFLTWWLADTIWWWRAPGSFLSRSRMVEWAWRVTVFTMVINGAVVFASPEGRVAGVPLVIGLAGLWVWPDRLFSRRST